jgi:hypothetical protein
MALTREELEHLTRKGDDQRRLTTNELAQLPPEARAIAAKLHLEEQQKLRELMLAQAAELAKLDARIERKARFLRKVAVRQRVAEALTQAGAGKHAELLAPHVETRVRAIEEDGDIAGFQVVDRDGKPRLRDGRPMRVEELMDELRRDPDLQDFFTKNHGRQR